MLLVNTLTHKFHLQWSLYLALMLILCFKFNGTTQNISVINNGCNIYVAGNGSILGTPTISIHGSYLNLNDGISDGRIEENFGNIWLDENWTNNANNNVFTNLSSSNSDGIVTFHNTTNIQYIDGINPTNFENIYLNDYRKKLLNDNNLVNGILHLDAALDLNSHNFIINNANPTAINYISGFIKSETFPGNYSLLQWNIGAGLGVYSVPFGSDYQTFNDLNYSIDIQTPMADGDNIKFATYPTDIYNNPLPTGASNLELEVLKVVDRYWIISPSNPLNKPKVNMTFSFSSNDINSGYNSINIKNLKASRNNSTLGKWMDMTPRGYNAANTVTIENVMPADFFDAWTLVNIPGPLANVFVPDAFTPNGDGLNDEFLPVFQVDYQIISYDFYIFDRWGNIQLHTSDETKGWNGKKDNVNGVPNIGVYSWLIIVKGKNSENLDGDGVKEKFIGKVTLLK